jgi:hypothetical protein
VHRATQSPSATAGPVAVRSAVPLIELEELVYKVWLFQPQLPMLLQTGRKGSLLKRFCHQHEAPRHIPLRSWCVLKAQRCFC